MKKILLSFLILIFLLPTVHATVLVPSLTTQMAKQDQLNKKNEVTKRLTQQAKIKKEAKDRALALKYERLVKKNINSTTIIPIQSTKIIALAIKHPPEITPLPVVSIPNLNNSIAIPPNVDIAKIRSTWIGWYNSVRKSEGLGIYNYDTRLDSTAYDWNIEFAKGKGLNHHTRNPGDGYYNFSVIDSWFMARGVNPIIIDRAKHTENVGYGYYSCNSSDCTDALIRSIRSTFDFFMSEKGKSYNAHYRSIVQPNFTKIGLSVIVVPNEQRYYLTVHYITN